MVLVVDGVAVAAVSRVLFDVGGVVVNVTVPPFAAVVAVAAAAELVVDGQELAALAAATFVAPGTDA